MHCVNSNENNSTRHRVLKAGELLGQCRLLGWGELDGITCKGGMAGMTARTGLAKALRGRIRWGTVRVCELAWFSGITICQCLRPS